MPTRSRKLRVAVGACLFEGNYLSPKIATISTFKDRYFWLGNELITLSYGASNEIAGAVRALEVAGAEILPLIATHGGAGGQVSAVAWQELKREMLARIREVGRLDAVYLSLHGAMVCEDTDDAEGDLLAEVRSIVGEVPIAVSLDIHAHVTEKMVDLADIIVGYQTYPHDDCFETGRRAVWLLLRSVLGQIKPTMRARKIPMIMHPQRERTYGKEPMSDFFTSARYREARGDVLAASYFLVQPWLNVPDLGCAMVVVTDNKSDHADKVALEMAENLWDKRNEFKVLTHKPKEAIAAVIKADGGPFVFVEVADSMGAGATGASAQVVREMLESGMKVPAAIVVVDPETVNVAKSRSIGAKLKLQLGNKLDPLYGNPVDTLGEVLRLGKGDFIYSGGPMGGTKATLGDTALIRVGPIDVVVASTGCYEYADEQFRAAGLNVRDYKIVVVKSPMNYQQAYSFAKGFFVLDTPGPATANLESISLPKPSRPLFPLDSEFEPKFKAYKSQDRLV
jgi:microcystin degradation protein MlrC